mmetsp:Transcript_23982/g.61026  ORF Transcript_23982/g.61026 Transcript_23982/m.61026 type:complete len:158 (-) Transcript_23982:131-604(-)
MGGCFGGMDGRVAALEREMRQQLEQTTTELQEARRRIAELQEKQDGNITRIAQHDRLLHEYRSTENPVAPTKTGSHDKKKPIVEDLINATLGKEEFYPKHRTLSKDGGGKHYMGEGTWGTCAEGGMGRSKSKDAPHISGQDVDETKELVPSSTLGRF